MSAPVLGFDLTRLDGGAAAADVLLRALTVTADDLPAIAAAQPDEWSRVGHWLDVDSAARTRRRVSATATSATSASGPASPGLRSAESEATGATREGDASQGPRPARAEASADLAATLAALERAPIGTVDGLTHLVRHDIFDWTWRRHPGGLSQIKPADKAAAVVCDAAAAAYLWEMLPDATRRELTAPWLTAISGLPQRAVDLGPQATAVDALVERVAGMSPQLVRKLGAASGKARPALADWAQAVHSASWSVFVAGRVRASAAAQLMLVQAVENAGVPVADRASGVWNLLSGAVQALVVRDVLDGPTLYRLLDPVVSVLGPVVVPRRPVD
ncbi:hypothetical protein [Virgisporangium ochraceum]|uniref:hypothetical protein n=1 Tax=Virgisporangium ochraceum TaxID=65505 RepID=UPI0019411D36|nr:hypothetical protein [Virgisporangium ochraceum]